ncbi:CASP-like protein 2C3 [Triticum dicoccoides]|uniref:CASP-like protein n=1 Tax=Triticum aestivum TaxID=4565 RepID=A0A3B6SN35_WHEAT|nr:CASP-like protein 2C3 [Triticum dicoccoides]XP_044434924.1 CASP-like protein 2C3 [Triticum aestivum]
MDAAAQAGRRRPSEVRAEGLMRGACAALATASALLMGLDTQTETVLLIRKKATVKDVHALWVLTAAAGAAAGYHLLHLLRCLYLGRFAHNPCRNSRALAWAFFLLDKGCAYVTFAATVAAAQACLIALDGAQALQWNKVCNIFTRFCQQVAGSLVCGGLAAAGTAVLSALSARNLFRLYPSLSRPHPQRSSSTK